MKKSSLNKMLSVALLGAIGVGLAGCGDTNTEMGKKIKDAQNMSLAELEAAAQEEFEAAGIKFTAQSSTSGTGKALAKFKAKYTWFDYEDFSSCKDSEAYTALSNTVAQGNHWTDFALLQEGSSFKDYYDEHLMHCYMPSGDDITVDASNEDPLIAVYCNKLFLYNKANYTANVLSNVWQLTGKDGASKTKFGAGLSFQNPNTENINMTFLVSMTSPEGIARLETAYQSYFGHAYQKQEGYKNIAYYFISEFLGNVQNVHDSDSKCASTYIPADGSGFTYVIGLNKMKSYAEGHNWQDEVFVSGVTGHLEGFDGFTYAFYAGIPETTKLPYTACLFSRYLFTSEGFKAGWKDAGYYSANTQVSINADYDMNAQARSQYTLVEDANYVGKNWAEVSAFVASCWNK